MDNNNTKEITNIKERLSIDDYKKMINYIRCDIANGHFEGSIDRLGIKFKLVLEEI